MSMESPGAFNQASAYSAEVTRRAVFAAFARTAANSPGVLAGGLIGSGDFAASAPASGLSVNIGVGEAIVGGTEGGAQGGYYARNASTTNLSISAADPTNPRIDQVVLTIADSHYTEPTGGSGDAAILQVITGTPTAGASLSAPAGLGTVPGSSLLLTYVLVPAGATSIVSGDLANKASAVKLGAAGLNYLQLLSPGVLQMVSGSFNTSWSGSSNYSTLTTITHNLGRVPSQVHATVGLSSNSNHAFAIPRNVTTTTFQVEAECPSSVPASGETAAIWWWVAG